MTGTPSEEMIAGARAYEALHVPAIFRPWCPHVLDAARVGPGQQVLDIACGTGVLTREAAQRIKPDGHVTGLDPAPGMLAVARELSPELGWHQGVSEQLPFPDNAFDAVVSQFGMMFFEDRSLALIEMRRVVKPDGRLAVAVWGGLEQMEAYSLLVNLVHDMAGETAAEALRAPFILGDVDALAALCESAGLKNVEISTVVENARYPGIRTMVEADLRGWLPVMGVFLDEDQIEAILIEAESLMAPYLTPEGEVVFGLAVHIITATGS